MPVNFPTPPAAVVGREDYISRFKARLEHFQVFLYGGIAGIGKTTLILRLAKETKVLGLRGAIYLPLWPAEGITSILARVSSRTGTGRASGIERQGDPYARLADFLENKRLALILDDIHNLRREELLSLLRAVRTHEGRYRVIGAGRGEPELSAIDRLRLHIERVGPLTADDVRKVASASGVKGEPAEFLVQDATRGGCAGHALTLRYMLALGQDRLPEPKFFERLSSRSVAAFKAVLAVEGLLDSKSTEILAGLSGTGLPVSEIVATKLYGVQVENLCKSGLLNLIDGDVYATDLLASSMVVPGDKLSENAAKTIAKHLIERATKFNEPLLALRASELLAKSGDVQKAVDTLTTVWMQARDLGFLEAYLKSVAAIPATQAMDKRLKLLSARARMRQGNVFAVRNELELLAKEDDSWTKSRAYAALTYVYSRMGEHKLVVSAYDWVRKATGVSPDLAIPAATLAAVSMARIGKIVDAEKLARQVLKMTKGEFKFLEREGELHRLLARVYALSGRLDEAVDEAKAAAKAFEAAGDLYHAATGHGYIGDLYRETGDFEAAKAAFVRFHELAEKWGDRDLLQVAELAEAWVSLDVGDLTHAAKRIAAVEREMSAAPSRRLKRYLAAAKALLEVGRGHHDTAAAMLARVIEVWQTSGARNITDILRAQRIRSLIACNELDKASEAVDEALARLDPKVEAPRVASFLRESALIRLRRKDVKRAMAELGQARRLFAKGGNRREEALTLYRIAHAALEEGDIELATASVKEASGLARKIKHTRVIALCRELKGRIDLINGDFKAAVVATKDAMQSLRRLGDELGALHCSESHLCTLIAAGDLAGAIRLGPKVSDQAEKLEIREVRIRAIVLTGVALLRRGRADQAGRCFREIPGQALAPLTTALMWRLGEGLASVAGNIDDVMARRAKWVTALQRLPEARQKIALHFLEQLDLPPRERNTLRTKDGDKLVSTEEIGWLQIESNYDLVVDVDNQRLVDGGVLIHVDSPQMRKLINRLVIAAPATLTNAWVYEAAFGTPMPAKPEKKLKAVLKSLEKATNSPSRFKVVVNKEGFKLTLPKNFAFLLPRAIEFPQLRGTHRTALRLLRRYGTLGVQTIQEQCGLTRAAARRELGELVALGLVEAVRDGRGQAFRLA